MLFNLFHINSLKKVSKIINVHTPTLGKLYKFFSFSSLSASVLVSF